MKIVDKSVTVKEIVIRIDGIKVVDASKPTTFDFLCNVKGVPSGAIGVGNVHLWVGDNYFKECFEKFQLSQIRRLCKKGTLSVINKLDKIKL